MISQTDILILFIDNLHISFLLQIYFKIIRICNLIVLKDILILLLQFIINIFVVQLPASAILPVGRDRRRSGQHQHRQGGVLHPQQEGLAADHRHIAQGRVLRLRGRARRDLFGGTCANRTLENTTECHLLAKRDRPLSRVMQGHK